MNGRLNASPAAFQSVAIRDGAAIADGWVETVTDDADDGGLVLRFQGNGNYYLLAIRGDSRFGYANFEIYRVAGGEFINLAGPVDRQFVQGVHKTIRFEAEGSRLRAYSEGILVLQASDVAYTSGGFGLRHDNSEDAIGVTSRFELLRWASYRRSMGRRMKAKRPGTRASARPLRFWMDGSNGVPRNVVS